MKRKLTEAQILLRKHLLELGIETVYEWQFASPRKWAFDLYSHEQRMGFECNGHFAGKHGSGWSSDAEKLNTAQMMGIRVLVFSNRDVLRGKAKQFMEEWLAVRSTREGEDETLALAAQIHSGRCSTHRV